MTEITPQQWQEINAITEDYLSLQTIALSLSDVKEQFTKLYALCDEKAAPFFLFNSPQAAAVGAALAQLKYCEFDQIETVAAEIVRRYLRPCENTEPFVLSEDQVDNVLKKALEEIGENSLWSSRFQPYAAWLEGAKVAGVDFSDKFVDFPDGVKIPAYDYYVALARSFHHMLPYDEACFVSARPVEVHWQESELHNDKGPAVLYPDGFAVWALEGHLADEQLVMRPETQTIEQIMAEENEELKRIRINRYGWAKFMVESGATVRDVQTAPGGWREAVMATKDFAVLMTYDPSTGRPYALEVSLDCQTCAEAQRYLLGVHTFTNLKVNPKSDYPVVRT